MTWIGYPTSPPYEPEPERDPSTLEPPTPPPSTPLPPTPPPPGPPGFESPGYQSPNYESPIYGSYGSSDSESSGFGPPPANPPASEKPPRSPRWRPFVALALAALLGGGVGGGLVAATDNKGSASVGTTATPSALRQSSSNSNGQLSGSGLNVKAVIAKAEPAIVTIQSTVTSSNRGGFFGGGGGSGTEAGTGMILTSDGEVLTNAHVVADASDTHVTLANESKARSAHVIGADTANDVALLQIDNAKGLPTVSLGRSADLQVGDDAVAIGNALALKGGLTVTSGIISALNRSIDTDTGSMSGLIQTDAAISSGNSGGPLLNSDGQVVAINSAVAGSSGQQQASNIGFAIPIDKALPIVERLRAGGKSSDSVAFMGVSTSDPQDGSRGAKVEQVTSGSPASNAGLQTGDLITAINGTSVAGAAELGGVVRDHKPGDKVTVHYVRNGQDNTTTLTLGSRASG